jgi:hypothetical protein
VSLRCRGFGVDGEPLKPRLSNSTREALHLWRLLARLIFSVVVGLGGLIGGVSVFKRWCRRVSLWPIRYRS